MINPTPLASRSIAYPTTVHNNALFAVVSFFGSPPDDIKRYAAQMTIATATGVAKIISPSIILLMRSLMLLIPSGFGNSIVCVPPTLPAGIVLLLCTGKVCACAGTTIKSATNSSTKNIFFVYLIIIDR